MMTLWSTGLPDDWDGQCADRSQDVPALELGGAVRQAIHPRTDYGIKFCWINNLRDLSAVLCNESSGPEVR
jgi:hypothetical protein